MVLQILQITHDTFDKSVFNTSKTYIYNKTADAIDCWTSKSSFKRYIISDIVLHGDTYSKKILHQVIMHSFKKACEVKKMFSPETSSDARYKAILQAESELKVNSFKVQSIASAHVNPFLWTEEKVLKCSTDKRKSFYRALYKETRSYASKVDRYDINDESFTRTTVYPSGRTGTSKSKVKKSISSDLKAYIKTYLSEDPSDKRSVYVKKALWKESCCVNLSVINIQGALDYYKKTLGEDFSYDPYRTIAPEETSSYDNPLYSREEDLGFKLINSIRSSLQAKMPALHFTTKVSEPVQYKDGVSTSPELTGQMVYYWRDWQELKEDIDTLVTAIATKRGDIQKKLQNELIDLFKKEILSLFLANVSHSAFKFSDFSIDVAYYLLASIMRTTGAMSSGQARSIDGIRVCYMTSKLERMVKSFHKDPYSYILNWTKKCLSMNKCLFPSGWTTQQKNEWKSSHGIQRKSRISPELKSRVRELISRGDSLRSVSSTLSMSLTTVTKINEELKKEALSSLLFSLLSNKSNQSSREELQVRASSTLQSSSREDSSDMSSDVPSVVLERCSLDSSSSSNSLEELVPSDPSADDCGACHCFFEGGSDCPSHIQTRSDKVYPLIE